MNALIACLHRSLCTGAYCRDSGNYFLNSLAIMLDTAFIVFKVSDELSNFAHGINSIGNSLGGA